MVEEQLVMHNFNFVLSHLSSSGTLMYL